MILVLLALSACTDKPDTGPTLDTGWFTTPPDPECADQILRTFPADGAQDWYWRSPPTLLVASDDRDAYDAVLYDALGVAVPITPVWTGTQAVLELDAPLAASADYRLRVTDCLGPHDVAFRTSEYGAPLAVDPSDLIGRAYVFDIAGARWEQPPGVGPLMGLYFSDPILVGVEWASDTVVDLIGAQAIRDGNGEVRQWMAEPTWDFPAADFAASPYFEAAAPQIRAEFDGVALIVHDFALSATFSSDGARMGGGFISGVGDTRELGPVLNQGNDPAAACDLIEGFGVSCQPCPDGQPYCVPMRARDATGTWVPGLRVERRE